MMQTVAETPAPKGDMIGLVVEGGGMRCAYSAGVLDRFLDEGIAFDYCVGVSAGAANAVSYLAGQRGRNRRFYTTHLVEPGYFGIKTWLRTGDLFGLEYIYGDLTRRGGADPIDYDALMSNPCELEMVSTDATTGLPRYFSKHDLKPCDYRAIMASCALPAVCRPVEFEGGRYFDGGVSNSIPVDYALRQGCDRLVVLLTKPRDYVKQPERHRLLYRVLCMRYPAVVHALDHRHEMYAFEQERTYDLEHEGIAFVIAPSRRVPIGVYTMDAKANQDLYELGVSDFDACEESLLRFLSA